MKYILELHFSTDDFDPDEGETVESVRLAVANAVDGISEVNVIAPIKIQEV